ncbi:MAG: hypothetical protein FWD78_14070 [Treponema sp.]|nr:hypothetical protein [Treponema sp.]
MEENKFRGGKAILITGLIAGFLLTSQISCKTAPEAEVQTVTVQHDPQLQPKPEQQNEKPLPVPVITVSPYQEAVFTGSPLTITAYCESPVPLIITYYSSRDDYWMIRGGFFDGPVEPGTYYVNINSAPGYGYGPAGDTLVEFCIKKAPVTITAEALQSAPYNGSPRRVLALAEPDVQLSYSYYPNAQLQQAALEAFLRPDGNVQSSLSSALQNFTRVERAPVEQGVYYVLVFFPGNARYEPACAEVEFTIGPAVPRAPAR